MRLNHGHVHTAQLLVPTTSTRHQPSQPPQRDAAGPDSSITRCALCLCTYPLRTFHTTLRVPTRTHLLLSTMQAHLHRPTSHLPYWHCRLGYPAEEVSLSGGLELLAQSPCHKCPSYMCDNGKACVVDCPQSCQPDSLAALFERILQMLPPPLLCWDIYMQAWQRTAFGEVACQQTILPPALLSMAAVQASCTWVMVLMAIGTQLAHPLTLLQSLLPRATLRSQTSSSTNYPGAGTFYFGGPDSPWAISQTVSLTVGSRYRLQWWLTSETPLTQTQPGR